MTDGTDRTDRFTWGPGDLELVRSPIQLAAHPHLVRKAAEAHRKRLRRAIEADLLTPGGLAAAEKLVQSITGVLNREAAVETKDIPFTWRDMDNVLPKDLDHLIDQYYFGVGYDGAAVIFMGTEEGYGDVTADDSSGQVRTLRGLGFGSCGYCMVWLSDSSPVVLERLVGPGQFHPNSPFAQNKAGAYQRHPYDYHPWRQRTSTWRTLAQLMSLVQGGTGDIHLAEPIDPLTSRPRLGDITFQIDRSARPSPKQREGSAPSDERLQFLTELLTACRSNSRVLVLHGATYGSTATKKWTDANQLLSDAFLGAPGSTFKEIGATPRGRVFVAESSDGHAVFRTRGLNGPDASPGLLHALADAISGVLNHQS